MLATCTDDQLLKWKEVIENPRGDNFKFITTLRQVVVHMYNKIAADIINKLSYAVNDEINSRSRGINMDKKLEQRIARLEKMIGRKSVKNEQLNDPTVEAVYNTSNQISELCKSLAVMLKSTNDASWPDVENALSLCEDDFPQIWFDRYNRILSNK